MATRVRGVNGFSRVPDLPTPASRNPRPPKPNTDAQEAQTGGFTRRRRSFERSPAGRTRLENPATAPIGRDMGTGAPVSLPAASGFSHMRDQNLGRSLSGDDPEGYVAARTGVHPLTGRAVPSINKPHDVTPTVVPQRRWEDLHPNEQAATLQAAKRFGVTPASAARDYSAQLVQSHQRATSSGRAVPYSQDFYSGPSGPADRLTESAAANATHPAFPDHVDPHMVQSVANSITSPRNKFERTKRDGTKTYPNDEHANHAIQHALAAGPDASSDDVAASIGNAHGPSGGGMMGNIRRATFASHQLLFKGKKMQTLRNPVAAKARQKGATEGNKTFGTPSTQKTTAYVGAWEHPEDADSFLTTDVHTGHGFASHLGTAKAKTGTFDKKGKEKPGPSEVEDYIARTPHVHAFHDHIARQEHARLGLSPSTSNAQYVNRGQASQWGEERIQRPDLTDATQKKIYPPKGPGFKSPMSGSAGGAPIVPVGGKRSAAFGEGAGT
jgi:hypothetical protein